MYAMHSGEAGPHMPAPDMTLIVNVNSPLISKLDSADKSAEGTKKIAKQLYTLALLSQRQLSADELQSFLTDSFDLLQQM